MKRKNGEGSWGTKKVKGVVYQFYYASDGKYTSLTQAKCLPGRDFFILSPSIHETLFVPVLDTEDQKWCDMLVKGVNRMEVSREDRIADHSYFYDAGKDAIRICV